MSEPLNRVEIGRIREKMQSTFFAPGAFTPFERVAGQKGAVLFPKLAEIVEQHDAWEEVETELEQVVDEAVEASQRDAACERNSEEVRELLNTVIYNAKEEYALGRDLAIESYEQYLERRRSFFVEAVEVQGIEDVFEAENDNVIHVDFERQARM